MYTYNKPVGPRDIEGYLRRIAASQAKVGGQRTMLKAQCRRRYWIIWCDGEPHSAVAIATGKIYRVRSDRCQVRDRTIRGSIWDTEMFVHPYRI